MQKSLSLLDARRSLNLTQVQMAEMLDVTAEYISMIERGKKEPSKKLLNKFGLLLEKRPSQVSPCSKNNASCPYCAEKDAEMVGLRDELRDAHAVIRDLAAALAAKGRLTAPVADPACGVEDGETHERKRA